MAKIIAGIALLLAIGYALFPGFRPALISLAPFALILVCPLMMLAMMAGMHSGDKNNNELTHHE